MKRVWGVIIFMVVICVLAVIQVGVSYAALTFPEIALTDVETIAAGMLALLGTVWALKKLSVSWGADSVRGSVRSRNKNS